MSNLERMNSLSPAATMARLKRRLGVYKDPVESIAHAAVDLHDEPGVDGDILADCVERICVRSSVDPDAVFKRAEELVYDDVPSMRLLD